MTATTRRRLVFILVVAISTNVLTALCRPNPVSITLAALAISSWVPVIAHLLNVTLADLIDRVRAGLYRVAVWMAPENPRISRVVIAAVFAVLAAGVLASMFIGGRS